MMKATTKGMLVFHVVALTANPAAAQDFGRYATTDGYPMAALRVGAEGKAYFEILVGIDGLPKWCRITQSSGNADLDKATCDMMMRRAQFKPALDSDGKPVESYYRQSVNWEIPGSKSEMKRESSKGSDPAPATKTKAERP